MTLDPHALTTVEEVKAFLTNSGMNIERNGIWVFCDQGDATAATVEVTDTTIILTITGDTPSAETLTFADSDKNTLSELITEINDLSGWKSGRIGHADAESTDLIVTGALSCLDSENEMTLRIEDNYLIERLIERATDLMERYCNRLFDSRNYSRETYYGNGFNKLILDQYPVIGVTRLSVGRANSFSIKNTSTDANFCTVEVTATKMRLIVDGGTKDSDEELTLADYATIDDLITAINDLNNNWSITTMATDTDERDASELLIRPSMFVDTTKQAYCETVDDDFTDYRLLKPTEARNEGILYKPGVFASGREYFVSYVAGYTAIPYSLEQACIELVAYKYGQSKRAGSEDLQSETFGEGADYKYVKFNLADIKGILPPSLLAELDLFKKRSF